jgi:DNA polymerase-3 subunit delta'
LTATEGMRERPPLDADLPWLREARETIERALQADRLGHALLLHVAPGAGGDWLARWIAARVLCTAAASRPCGRCVDCRRVVADEHPDVLFVAPEGDSREIRIDQIRLASAELALTSHGGRMKVAVFSPADRMNRFASNALLKTLEEPTRGTQLILVASQPMRLPATVRSRCQRLAVREPAINELAAWLEAQRGPAEWGAVLSVLGPRPLDALARDPVALARLQQDTAGALSAIVAGELDPVGPAERWSRDEPVLRFAAIENWITERVTGWALGSARPAEMRVGRHLPAPARALNIRALFEALDLVREARRLEDSPVNKALLIERLLWGLAAAGGRARSDARERS